MYEDTKFTRFPSILYKGTKSTGKYTPILILSVAYF